MSFAGGLSDGLITGNKMNMERDAADRAAEAHDENMKTSRSTREMAEGEANVLKGLGERIAKQMGFGTPAPTLSPDEQTQAADGNLMRTAAAPARRARTPYLSLADGGLARIPDEEAPAAIAMAPASAPQQAAAPAQVDPAAPGLTPIQPAAAPAQSGPQTDEDKIAFGIYSNPNQFFGDPKFLNEVASEFLKVGSKRGIEWLERGYTAQKEGAIQALQQAVAGDLKGAEESFNRSGKHRIVPGTLKPTEDGKQLTMQLEGGGEHTFEPRQALRSYLDPKAFFDMEHREKTQAETARHNKATEGVAQQNAATNEKYRADMARNQSELTALRKSIAASKADPTEKDWQRVGGNMRALLTKTIDASTEIDPVTQKKGTNPLAEFMPEIVSKAMESARKGVSPELALEQSYIDTRNKFDEVKGTLGTAFGRAKETGSGWFKGEKDAIAELQRNLNPLMQGEGAMSLAEVKRYAKAAKLDTGLLEKAYGGGSKPIAAAPDASPGLTPKPVAAAPAAATAAEKPPVAGAKKAPDGKWYVQKDGKHYRVE